MNELNNKIEALVEELRQDVLAIAEHYDDEVYQHANYPTKYARSNMNGTFGEFEKALQTLITEQVRLGRIDELLSSDDVIRLHGLEDYQAYLTKRIAQLKSGSKGEDEV